MTRKYVGIKEEEHSLLEKIKVCDSYPSLRYTLEVIIKEAAKKRKVT